MSPATLPFSMGDSISLQSITSVSYHKSTK
jgi:hypothetical protein